MVNVVAGRNRAREGLEDHPVDAADMPPVLVDKGHARIPRTVGAARPLQAPEPRLLGELEEVKDEREPGQRRDGDRKSTRLNSSHVKISYAVFCLKKKK